ncbi:hypothetical protein THAOC_26790 [Thalassiosira oceanica]|uniref:Uncharacterized protein n=1 Tax=Thalassiosira oceanica TaxID=159749 RepID=K0S4C6_THAOC|nr:hypothetical protein THAOC_26790 [Thalassiosira oceanica]|eukprot:EJK53712.1 hypothetical protein THAOC_26790 [Thalassiosira oceanica]
MPSKKKARGRKNRAKKEATRTADLRGQWEPTINIAANNNGVSCCVHMLAVPPQIPQEGPVVSFMNHMAGEGIFDKASVFLLDESAVDICCRTVVPFPVVHKGDNERSMAIDLLLRFLRNVFVRDAAMEGELWFQRHHDNEVIICIMIYLLELLGRYSDVSVVVRRAAKMSNKLMSGNRRDREVRGQAPPLHLSEGAAPRCEEEARESRSVLWL